MSNQVQFCRVCGFEDTDQPYGSTGNEPSYALCPCCNVEHGYEDYTVESSLEYRKTWLAKGANFTDVKLKPAAWNLAKQLQNIPQGYV
jgi:hypothetical protein